MRNDMLVAYLLERQNVEDISAAEMSRRLGISEANWCHTRKGRRQLHAPQVSRALVLYPELREMQDDEAKAS